MRLENKVVVITGGGSGIGRETVILFTSEGAQVVVVDVNDAGGNDFQLASLGGNPPPASPL